MSSDFDYFKGEEDKEFVLASMQKYVDQKQELDKLLERIVAPLIEDRSLFILDACCGIGHIANLLSQLSPTSTIVGIDKTPYLIDAARSLFASNSAIEFQVGDVIALGQEHKTKADLVVCWKTISWLPSYEEITRSLLALTGKTLVLSSLFYDEDIDFQITVRDYQKERGQNGGVGYYNIYSLPTFIRFVKNCVNCEISVFDFDISIDLPKPEGGGMGTYTELTADGRRLQLSGPVLMLWKTIMINLR